MELNQQTNLGCLVNLLKVYVEILFQNMSIGSDHRLFICLLIFEYQCHKTLWLGSIFNRDLIEKR